jgi:hypothetical protein
MVEKFEDVERLRNAPATSDSEHTERFTDEELAYLRYVRFGRLPDPIPPSDWSEAADPDTTFEPPESQLGAPYAA